MSLNEKSMNSKIGKFQSFVWENQRMSMKKKKEEKSRHQIFHMSK